MRKIVLELSISLDGFTEGPSGEIDWYNIGDDIEFRDFLEEIDTIFYGRITYDLYQKDQPDDTADPIWKGLYQSMNNKNKYVFSTTKRVENDTITIIDTDIVNRVKEIKSKPGKNIWLFGGNNLITTFVDLNLIDEYRFTVHPIILGKGKSVFTNIKNRANLKLIQTNPLKSGVTQLCFEPDKLIYYTATAKFGPTTHRIWQGHDLNWHGYIAWLKLAHVKEIISLDIILGEKIVEGYNSLDEYYLVGHQPHTYRSLDYLRSKLKGKDPSTYNLLAVKREPTEPCEGIYLESFEFIGYDLLNVGISSLTNCDGFHNTFLRNELLNEFGLINLYSKAVQIREDLLKNNPDEPHADCIIWAIWRMK